MPGDCFVFRYSINSFYFNLKIGAFVQLLLMPMLVPALGEEKLLSIGLFFSCVHVSTLSLCSYSLFLTFHNDSRMSTFVNSLYMSSSNLIIYGLGCRCFFTALRGPSGYFFATLLGNTSFFPLFLENLPCSILCSEINF
jgi:hypothetical protein